MSFTREEPLPLLANDGGRGGVRVMFCDAGHDQAAYRGDRDFRVSVPLGSAPDARAQQGTFRWSPGATPEFVARDVALAKELVAYRRERKQVRYHGEALSAEEVARLRALGYAVPEREGH